MSRKISINISPCPNDIYIFGALIKGVVEIPGVRLDFDFLDIEQLNQKAVNGEGDVVKVSAANWVRLKKDYELIPNGGALGLGCGPLLLANLSKNRSLEPYPPQILVPGEYTTAHFLLNFYLQKRSVGKSYVRYDHLYKNLMRTPGAYGVVIHESRFTFKQDGLSLVKDLGEYWESKTSLPIPLGIIVAKKNLTLGKDLKTAIVQSINWAENNTQEVLDLCRLYSQNMEDSVMLSHIRLYVNEYSLDMGDKGREALEKLLSLQAG